MRPVRSRDSWRWSSTSEGPFVEIFTSYPIAWFGAVICPCTVGKVEFWSSRYRFAMEFSRFEEGGNVISLCDESSYMKMPYVLGDSSAKNDLFSAKHIFDQREHLDLIGLNIRELQNPTAFCSHRHGVLSRDKERLTLEQNDRPQVCVSLTSRPHIPKVVFCIEL